MPAIKQAFFFYDNKKGEFPRLECFHNGIILIVICFVF